MKIFFLLRALIARFCGGQIESGDDAESNWQRDPLAHPTLQAMDLDQLADLPFDPRAVCRQ
ncbi:hypothetical protein [Phyllobacterium chamaecytisi]|uniref:hypothetical protein n=1 Tax=Phyllobacterium chamaecytisi TaxID=2876082 RepID=UPI001CCF1734|nr:hypothetical protein [Phyllobacterium sp. KW56]MBZ9604480.1 hypothetical protein [Phyllobacterium sp. KW56]